MHLTYTIRGQDHLFDTEIAVSYPAVMAVGLDYERIESEKSVVVVVPRKSLRMWLKTHHQFRDWVEFADRHNLSSRQDPSISWVESFLNS